MFCRFFSKLPLSFMFSLANILFSSSISQFLFELLVWVWVLLDSCCISTASDSDKTTFVSIELFSCCLTDVLLMFSLSAFMFSAMLAFCIDSKCFSLVCKEALIIAFWLFTPSLEWILVSTTGFVSNNSEIISLWSSKKQPLPSVTLVLPSYSLLSLFETVEKNI